MVVDMKYKNRLINLRVENNLQQLQLSKILGVQKDVYGHYEREETLISTEKINVLCNYYGVSFDYIFELTNIRNYKNAKRDINHKLLMKRLKEFRIENKLTQDKLAKMLNTTQSTISGYESGKTIILASFLFAICSKYKISADYLLGRTDEPKYLK